MLTKKIEDLTLADINAELEFTGAERGPFKRIDHAKGWLTKAIVAGDVKVSDAVAKSYGVKPANTDPKPKKERAPKEKPSYDFQPSELDGRLVYTAKGTGIVKGFDKDAGRFLVVVKTTGAEIAMTERSVRFKAVDDGYRENYVHDTSTKTESGNTTIHCGDDLAYTMAGLVQAELAALARENGLEERWDEWAGRLNPGMCRMNLGNVLRRKIKAGEKVTFFKKELTDARETRETQLAREAEKAKKSKKKA